ncbi:hypothetical protein HY030_02480 [Candidatus Gottesmanbacteria bacterium]|nr:hypothetical protein [Candidatus Gottesmanbacteria bacterium]
MIWQIFGTIKTPYLGNYAKGDEGQGLILLLNNTLKLLFVVGGIIMVFNLVFAAFQFLNSGGDPKNIETAWNKIWHSLIGLLIIVASFLIASIAGIIFFGDPTAILKPKIYSP